MQGLVPPAGIEPVTPAVKVLSLNHSAGIPPRHLYFLKTGYKPEGSHQPLLRFNNLLEPLTETRKALDSLFPVYFKEYNLGTTRWKRCLGQGMGEGQMGEGRGTSMTSLGTSSSQHPMSSPMLMQD